MRQDTHPLAGLIELLNAAFETGAQVAPDGSVNLLIAQGQAIVISPSPDGNDIVFHSALASLNGFRDVVMMAAALSLNLHQERTRGGAIGLHMESQSLVFSWRTPASQFTDDVALVILENFCRTAQELAAAIDAAVGEFSTQELADISRRAHADPDLLEPATLDDSTRPPRSITPQSFC